MTQGNEQGEPKAGDGSVADDVPIPGAIPAATLVIMRPSADAGDEILLVKRSAKMVFAAGAVVFPGGRIDPDDHVVAERHGWTSDPADGAARVAAIRETIEETGLAVGWSALSDPATIATIRRELLGGRDLSSILDSRSERLELDSLVPFARWCPNFKETRTFDTRFYAVQAPEHDHQLTIEEAEHSHIFWSRADQALEAADRGEVSVIFPTRRNLERLALYRGFADFAAHARKTPIRRVTPWIEQREGGAALCIPDGLGYPVLSEPIDRAMRG